MGFPSSFNPCLFVAVRASTAYRLLDKVKNCVNCYSCTGTFFCLQKSSGFNKGKRWSLNSPLGNSAVHYSSAWKPAIHYCSVFPVCQPIFHSSYTRFLNSLPFSLSDSIQSLIVLSGTSLPSRLNRLISSDCLNYQAVIFPSTNF